jgi:hypothetical protein
MIIVEDVNGAIILFHDSFILRQHYAEDEHSVPMFEHLRRHAHRENPTTTFHLHRCKPLAVATVATVAMGGYNTMRIFARNGASRESNHI